MKDNGLDHAGTMFQHSIYHYDKDKRDQNKNIVPIIQRTYTADGHKYRVRFSYLADLLT
jgi:hypothetical protein